MTPTRFDIYVRGSGRWSCLESLPGDDKNGAIARAADLDSAAEHEGVRVMAVTEYESGRSPLETLTWISPHLSKVAAVTRQTRTDAQSARAQVAPKPALTEEPEPASEPNPPSASILAATAAPAPAPMVPAPGVDTALAAKVALNAVYAVALATVSFVPITLLLRSISDPAGLSTEAQQRIALAAGLLVFFGCCGISHFTCSARARAGDDRRTARRVDIKTDIAPGTPCDDAPRDRASSVKFGVG